MTVGYHLRVLTDRGKLDEADQLLDETVAAWSTAGVNSAARSTMLSGAAHLHLARGRWTEALRASRDVGELMAGREACGPIAAWK